MPAVNAAVTNTVAITANSSVNVSQWAATTLGAATATSVNGLTITSSTGALTIAAGKTLTASNTLTFTGTDSSSVAFGAGGTVLYANQTITLSGDTTGSGTTAITTTTGKVNGVTYPTAPSANTVPVVTSAAGGGTVTYEIVPVAAGGTNLASGTSGGIPGYTAPGTMASSGLLTANALVLGGGAGATPTVLGSLGTTTTVLHGNAAGAPTFGAVSLTVDVSGNLPNANLASQTANTVLGALTATTPSGLAVPSCSTASSALTWTTSTGFGCNTISGASGANPTATAGPTANNGVAATFMRSDATPAIQKASNAQLGLAQGDGQTITIASATGVASITAPIRTVTTSPTVAATDMGGQIVSNVSGGGTITIPAISSTVFASGMSLSIVNYSASTAAISTTPTVNAGGGCVTATGIPTGDSWQMLSNGTTIDCIQTVNAGSAGTINSSSASNFAYYSGSTAISGATIAANALPKSNGASAPTASLITDNGNIASIGEGALTTPFGLTDGASIAVNAFLSNNFTVTLGGNRTLANPTNTTAGQWLDFVITQDGSGSRTLAFGAGYLNSAGAAFTATLNSAAAGVTTISCKVIATTPTLQCYGPQNSAAGSSQPSNKTAPASTTTFFMQGLAGTITPVTTGNVMITINGTLTSTTTTAGDGITFQVSHGTGSAPANAAALTGTQDGTIQTYRNPATVTAADVDIPFSQTVVLTGLTIGTAYWIDEAAKSVGTASSAAMTAVNISAVEIR